QANLSNRGQRSHEYEDFRKPAGEGPQAFDDLLRAAIDAKRRRSFGEQWMQFAAVTSNVPFAAIVAGKNRLGPWLPEAEGRAPLESTQCACACASQDWICLCYESHEHDIAVLSARRRAEMAMALIGI